MGYDQERTSYREFVHMRLAMLQKQLLDAVEAINRLKHLDKEKTEAEKEAAIAALEKKCTLLRAKIKEQEDTDVKKEREAVVVPIYVCDGCKKDIEGTKQWHSVHLISVGSERYHCTECKNWDFCLPCYKEKGATHGHPMYFEAQAATALLAELAKLKCVGEVLAGAFRLFANRPCLGYRPTGPNGKLLPRFQWLTFAEVWTRATAFGAALRAHLNCERGSFVGICARNRLEWFIADIACLAQGIVVVPIHYNLDAGSVASILNNSDVSVVVTSQALMPLFLSAFEKGIPTLRQLVQMDSSDLTVAAPAGLQLHRMHELEAKGAETLPSFVVATGAAPTDLVTLVYTSGSTGVPKGAIINNSIWLKNTRDGSTNIRYDPQVSISKDPLAHISDREHTYTVLLDGGRVGITYDIATVFEDIQLLNPNELVATPRFWNVIYSDFKRAFDLGQEELRTSGQMDAHSLAALRRKLLVQFKTILGTRLAGIGLGGAASSPVVKEFLVECYGPIVADGYGSTEAGSIARDDGTIANGVRFKLVDVPELQYFTTDQPFPRGELWIQSATLIPGYYKNPTETAKAFTADGWFRTGDIVEQNGNKVKIIDRLKNIFKLSQGEYVAPEKVETAYLESKFIDQIFVTCADLTMYEQNNVLAVVQSLLSQCVVPNAELVQHWCEENQVTAEKREAEVKKMLMQDMARIAAQAGLRPFEVPQGILLEIEKFTIENGRMTHSNKLARPVLDRHYRNAINDLLKSLRAAPVVYKGSSDVNILVSLVVELLGVPADRVDLVNGNLRQLGADSLAALRLSNAIRDRLNISVPMDALIGVNASLSSLVTFITQATSSPMPTTAFLSTRDMIQRDSVLPEDFKWAGGVVPNGPHSVVFLTGATGFIGAHVLHYLLTSTKATKIYCLVRSDISRLASAMAKLEIPLKEEDKSRIVAVQGTLEAPAFGLAPELWTEIASSVTILYHVAAFVNHYLAYEDHRSANVLGTLNILRLAATGIPKTSSLSVFSTEGASRHEGEDIEQENVGALGGYGQSKWVSERLVAQARNRGFPTVIFRCGMTSWNTTTGAGNDTDWLCRLIRGIIALGAAPLSSAYLSLVPVDFTARAMVHVGEHAQLHLKKNFHFDAQSLVASNELIKWIASAPLPDVYPPALVKHLSALTQPMAHALWFSEVKAQLAKAKSKERLDALTGLMLFPRAVPTDKSTMNCWQLNSALSGSGISLQRITPEIVAAHVVHLIRTGRLDGIF